MTPQDIALLPYRPCVGVMLVNSDGQVFVGQRNDRDHDAWQMPQGGMDEGETPRDAALRELWEETGIAAKDVLVLAETADWLHYDLPHDVVPHIWHGRFRGQKQKWFLLRFKGGDADIDIATKHPEFTRWKWMPPGDLLNQIVAFKREVYAQVLDEFSALI